MLNMPLSDIKSKISEQAGLSAQEVDSRIAEKMKQLSGLISEEGAAHIVANELKVSLMPSAEDRKIKDLLPGMRDVQQDMRVVQVYELRTFESKYSDGQGKVASLLGGDESGVIRVTGWGERADELVKLSPGDTIRVKNAYIKENQGRAELHLNNNSTIIKNPEGVEIKAPEGRGEERSQDYERRKINELSRGDYRVELLGTVVQVYDPRFFERKDGTEGMVTNIMIDDGTGTLRIGCFDEQASKALGKPVADLMAGKDGSFEEEKTHLLGAIIKVKGRAKLNTVYNSIEVTADEIEESPDAASELEKSGGAKKEAPAEKKAESAPEKAPAEAEQPEKKQSEDAVSLEELDDLDLDDLEDLEE